MYNIFCAHIKILGFIILLYAALMSNRTPMSVDLLFTSKPKNNVDQDSKIKIIQNNKSASIYPTDIEYNDLVINEILFDPLSGCEEYVEIYNRSDKIFNFKNVMFGRIKYSTTGLPDTSLCKISDTSIYINPQEYWVLSPSPEKIQEYYFSIFPNHFIQVDNLPTLINKEGYLFLVSDSGKWIDLVYYHENFHHPLLNFTDGVALEKIHVDKPGTEKNSWQSASPNIGFGTPAYKNSQYLESNDLQDKIIISPEVFSPNQDGVNEVLSISLSLEKSGNMVNISIFDSNGQQIKQLVKNELAGSNEIYYWEGLDENNERLSPGIYIIYLEIFNIQGIFTKHKQTITLVSSFN